MKHKNRIRYNVMITLKLCFYMTINLHDYRSHLIEGSW